MSTSGNSIVVGGKQSSPRALSRILCLHGYCQNAAVLRAKTHALRKSLRNEAELVYIDAPHIVPTTTKFMSDSTDTLDDEDRGIRDIKRRWWERREGDNTMIYDGFDESIQYLNGVWAEQVCVPFSMVFGRVCLLRADVCVSCYWRFPVF